MIHEVLVEERTQALPESPKVDVEEDWRCARLAIESYSELERVTFSSANKVEIFPLMVALLAHEGAPYCNQRHSVK